MSAATAFNIVAIAAAVCMIGGWTLWKFRYVILSGYFRAEIICESGEVKIFTMRLKKSNEFSALVEGVRDTYHILDGGSEKSRRIYRVGRQRIPKSYYNAHQAEPIDMQELRKDSKVSATRYSELARNTVTSGLLDAFKEVSIREQMMQLMMVLIPLAGIILLGYFLNSRIETVIQKLGG